MRRRASAAVTGLRKRLSAGSVEPPSVPVFFNLLPEAEMWPKTGRIGEQRLTLVQYWRQMQRGMTPEQGSDVAPAADSTASAAPSVGQTGQTVYVNGQPLQPSDQTVSAAPAAQAVTLLGASTIAKSPAAEPHTAFKLEDFDDDLEEDRVASVATHESASVDGPTPASHASTDEIPAAATDSTTPDTQPIPVPSVLEAAGILVDPPAAADTAETPAAHVLAFARESEPADAESTAEAIQPSVTTEPEAVAPAEFAAAEVAEMASPEPVEAEAAEAVEMTWPEPAEVAAAEAVEVAEEAVVELATLEPGDAAELEPAEIVAFEPDLELGSLEGFTHEPARARVPDEEVADLAADAFVVDGHDAAFESFESARRVDPAAGGFDAFAVDFLSDASSDLSAVADSMVEEATHDAAVQGSVPDLQLEDLTPAEPIPFEAVADVEPVDDVSLDLSLLVGERAEPLVEAAADEPVAEAIVEAVIEDAIAEPAAPMVEAVADSVAEEAALDPITESIVAEPVADHAEPLVEVAVPEPHDAAWEQPEAHEAVAASEFAAPIAADAPGRETQDEVTDVIEVSMPAASASTFVAPLTDDVHGVELHDEDAAEVMDIPAAAASTFAAPLTADATPDDHGGDTATADLHLPAALADSSFADVMHAGLDHSAAGEADGARAAADAPQMPAFEADGVWNDAMSEWATTTRDTRLRRAGVIPMPRSKPLPVPVVSSRSAIPALERFMRSAQARRRRVTSESVA